MRPKKTRVLKFDASIFLLGLIVALLGGGIFVTIGALRADPIEGALTRDRVINALFVFEGKGKPLGTYVFMYYPGTKRAAVFDIPGEVGLILQKINRVDRIDTVYDPQRVSTFENEIERLLDIDISFTFVLDTVNLGKAVDIIEGVEIFIPSPVELYNEDTPVLFPFGVTRLDGDKARLYVTYELPEENHEVVTFRRQRFFLGFIKRLGEQNEVLKNPLVAQTYQSLFKTGTNQRVRTRLFDEYAGIDIERVNIQSVGGNIREVSGKTLLIPYYDGTLIKDIVRQTLTGLTRLSEGSFVERVFTVEVLNGTATVGLAGRTAELLQGFGYEVISIGNADRSDYESTVIIDRSGNENMVRTFGDIIKCKNFRFEQPAENSELEMNLQNLEYRSDFILIIGNDFKGRYVDER
ncbi:MAG: LytR C-terminal domain-containing protein [Spirochaetaceae bacterium]|jgi:anionic cell wall polymer biosynthesis LytR-Cps2A-Psr (LCP) family protein|nr:LytR C-terminal domain-containing protein [Spirochaetaceae bacterium]